MILDGTGFHMGVFCAFVLTCVCMRARLHVCVVWCVAISHSTCADLSVHTYGVSFISVLCSNFKKIELRAKLSTPHSKKKDEIFNPKIWFANLWLAHVWWTSTKSERAGETCNLITTCKKMNLGFNLCIYLFLCFNFKNLFSLNV